MLGWREGVPLVLPEFGVRQACLVGHAAVPTPGVSREITLPQLATLASCDRLPEPSRQLLLVCQLGIALGSVGARIEWPGKGRKGLVLATAHVQRPLG